MTDGELDWPTIADVNPNALMPNIGVVRYTDSTLDQTEEAIMKVTLVVEAETLPQLASGLAIATRSINLNDPRHLPKKIVQEGTGWKINAVIDIPEPAPAPAAKGR